MADTHTVAEATHALISHDTAYWGVLVAGLVGLAGMMFGETKKNWLAIGAGVSWLLIFLAYPYEEATAAGEAAIFSMAELVIFLLLMMTIIEGGVHYGMMNAILRLINTSSKRVLMIIVGVMSFVLSAVLDNLTAAIVMGVLVTQLMSDARNRAIFACLIIAAANAGGVPSAIGNTTSILLWVGGQITIEVMFTELILPSLMYLAVIFLCFWPFLGGAVERPVPDELSERRLEQSRSFDLPSWQQWTILFLVLLCIGSMIGAKVLFHLPPVFGAMLAFAIWSTTTYFMNRKKGAHFLAERDVRSALKHIDHATVMMFTVMLPLVSAVGFVGILDDLAVILTQQAALLADYVPQEWGLTVELGLISSTVPNTPLVAASQVMFDYPQNDPFWILLNYTTGVGGVLLPFGSAAGVVLMSKFRRTLTLGMYVRVMTLPALLAFMAGLAVIYVQMMLF